MKEEESFDGHERGHADGEEGVETAQPTGSCTDDEPRPENDDSLLADQLPHESEWQYNNFSVVYLLLN